MSVHAPDRRGEALWSNAIPEMQWALFVEVIEALRKKRIGFALGGAFALAHYTGLWRNTKDLDVYLLPAQRGEAIAVLTALGFEDYFNHSSYDRGWLFRGVREEIITDLIWAHANQVAEVDGEWLHNAQLTTVRALEVTIIPPEELVWAKLYVLQRERCDWPDLLNLLYFTVTDLQWDRLLQRVGGDSRLLAGLLAIFSWMCPGAARQIPSAVWSVLGLELPAPGPSIDEHRVRLIDSRPWFSALIRT